METNWSCTFSLNVLPSNNTNASEIGNIIKPSIFAITRVIENTYNSIVTPIMANALNNAKIISTSTPFTKFKGSPPVIRFHNVSLLRCLPNSSELLRTPSLSNVAPAPFHIARVRCTARCSISYRLQLSAHSPLGVPHFSSIGGTLGLRVASPG